MLANRTSRWSIAAVVLSLALLAASWFLLVSPRRAAAAETRTQSVAAQSQADLLQQKINELKAQFADLPKRKAELALIQKELPTGAAIPKFVRDLQAGASQSGVDLNTLVPGAPAVVTASGTPAAAGAAASASSPQLVGIPVTLTITGDYFETVLFIKYLQTKLDRALLISSLSVVPAETTTSTDAQATSAVSPTATPTPTPIATVAAATDGVGVTITGSIFVLLNGETTLAEVTEAAKSATLGAPVPTSTSTPSAS